MALVLKGCSMPDCCDNCFFNVMRCHCELTTEDLCKDFKEKRADYCPLIEVPDEKI